MAQPNPFFQLDENPSKINSSEFYGHLDRSNHLFNSIYEPDLLDRRDDRVTRIVGKTFERVSFSKTEVKNIIFTNCRFIKCLFIGTRIRDCEFHNCQFEETNTHKIVFTNTYIDPTSFESCLDRKRYQNIGVHLFQNLMNNSRDTEQPQFEADAHFLFLRWKRYQEQYEAKVTWNKHKKLALKKRSRILGRFLWEWLFGSGIRIRHFIATVVTSVLILTCGNFVFRDQFGLSNGAASIGSIIDAFYFSTVTVTTLGFGDITPTTQLGRVVVAGQSILGFFLFATFASMLFRKIVP